MNTRQETLPRTVDEITPGWLTAALNERFPGTIVARADTVEVIWGTATKVRLRLSYSEGRGLGGLPERVCVKGGFDERLSGFAVETAYQLEATFFGEVAPTLEIPLPRCWYAGFDPDTHQGVLILDDLAAEGCTFGDPVEPWPVDRVAAALEVQAAWHRQTWECADGVLGRLGVGALVVRGAAGVLLGDDHWQQHFADADAPRLPAPLQDAERLRRGFEALWRRDDQGPLALAHGDAHIGNTYIDAAGQPAFLDWQCMCRAPSLYDVAYFLAGALDTEERRKHEEGLLRHYLDVLQSDGGPELPFDGAWQDYRRYVLHGFLWAVTPAVMQPMARVRAMAERYATAIIDHQALETLGV
jgi:hypothetical protein